MITIKSSLVAVLALTLFVGCKSRSETQRLNENRTRLTDESLALWSFYRFSFLDDGRVIARDEGDITTSEGQSYAMLRSVWANDRESFDATWSWTQENLQRPDGLFAWKWKGRVVDKNTATDADVDIALSLLLAGRRFENPKYAHQAMEVIKAAREIDITRAGTHYLPTAGNWTKNDRYVKVHVGYLAPYAYENFAAIDKEFPWKNVVQTSYDILHWIYDGQKLPVPPEFIFVDRNSGKFYLRHPTTGQQAHFSYDAFPLFWRIAVDQKWFRRGHNNLRQKMTKFFEEEFAKKGQILDRYSLNGKAISKNEGLPLYATLASLSRTIDDSFANQIYDKRLSKLWVEALEGASLPYYLHNWLWFDRGLEVGIARDYDEFLSFLRPFDTKVFLANFPAIPLALAVLLFFFVRTHLWIRVAFLCLSTFLCTDYLLWRLTDSLNFVEPMGPIISGALLIAEIYGFATLLLLWLQVGTKPSKKVLRRPAPNNFQPTVDIFIPIYTESLEILEATLIGANAIDYEKKRIFVCDDSHRDSVCKLAEASGAVYVKGPKKHAKAGNLNNALAQTDGELVVVFDTDHIPVTSFLRETVPLFFDERMGIVQTPHVFYNEDIFQRTFSCRTRIGNEQDMFNHAIQSGRDTWGGAFFVGSGAVFRRKAMEDVGGFNLLSITEDIHTSQIIHSKGWKSAFVDKNLAVGLSAENLLSYLVQRRRWMLGCLQIFFKDNPMKYKSLPLRHRIGYLASLVYFFYPAARFVFWLTPMYFLLFHWHPLLADIPALFAHLLPFMILRPMMNAALLPGWPRMFWGQIYEAVVAFPLFRAMFDLLLPKRLGFKVTPKGIMSEKRTFDVISTRLTLFAIAVSVIALIKGACEVWFFGIEKEAYFFNMSWAAFNLLFLFATLFIAWERPQRRTLERVRKAVPVRIRTGNDDPIDLITEDLSLGGIRVLSSKPMLLTERLTLDFVNNRDLILDASLVYQERISRNQYVTAFSFGANRQQRQSLTRLIFTDPATWVQQHNLRTQWSLVSSWFFFRGLFLHLMPQRPFKRRSVRIKTREKGLFNWGNIEVAVNLKNISPSGFCVATRENIPIESDLVSFQSSKSGGKLATLVHKQKTLGGSLMWGFRFVDQTPSSTDFLPSIKVN
ncbi:MAG: glycosyl hydrolase family 8 [Oligoflexales bacterium]